MREMMTFWLILDLIWAGVSLLLMLSQLLLHAQGCKFYLSFENSSDHLHEYQLYWFSCRYNSGLLPFTDIIVLTSDNCLFLYVSVSFCYLILFVNLHPHRGYMLFFSLVHLIIVLFSYLCIFISAFFSSLLSNEYVTFWLWLMCWNLMVIFYTTAVR